jgi:hypothetical protein
MPDDLYGDGPEQSGAPSAEKMTQPERDEETKGKTATINSEICPGMEPGDTMVLRITSVNEGEYVVEYEPSEEPKKGGEGEPSPQAPTGETMYD